MLRWKCWGRGDGSGGGDGGDGDCGARSHAACRGGPPWYAGEESSRAGRIFFASSALHRALGERQRFWFWADALHLSETAFCAPRNRPSPPNRFASRHLYQFQERSCCPPIPIGRYAAGYRGAITVSYIVCAHARTTRRAHPLLHHATARAERDENRAAEPLTDPTDIRRRDQPRRAPTRRASRIHHAFALAFCGPHVPTRWPPANVPHGRLLHAAPALFHSPTL